MALTLQDKQEITELTAKYNHAVDHQQPKDWMDTFTEDGELKVNGKSQAKGVTELQAFSGKIATSDYRGRHWVCNILIEGDGNTARLRMYVLSMPIKDNAITLSVMGEYDDVLVKTAAGWRFKTRNITFCGGASQLVSN